MAVDYVLEDLMGKLGELLAEPETFGRSAVTLRCQASPSRADKAAGFRLSF